MIYIYQADSFRIKQNMQLNNLLKYLPESMNDRTFQYKFEQDAYNFVLGRLLLRKGLKDLGLSNQIEHIEYQKNSKPFLKDVFFNISHTDNLVVCAISLEGEIGIDVEKTKPVVLEDFEPWFTIGEWSDIIKSTESIRKFYWYWTRKESIIKALGLTLSYLHQIEIDTTKDLFIEKSNKWYLNDLDFGADHTGALCSMVPIKEVRHFMMNDIE